MDTPEPITLPEVTRPDREKLEGGIRFEMVSEFSPAGDQPTAIAEISARRDRHG